MEWLACFDEECISTNARLYSAEFWLRTLTALAAGWVRCGGMLTIVSNSYQMKGR